MDGNTMIPLWIMLLTAYLIGSFPTAYLITRLVARRDIRRIGDGNMGAQNTANTIGFISGLTVALIDIGKGALTILLAQRFGFGPIAVMAAGFCAVVGHDFSVFLRFTGGQGAAAMVGIFLVLHPLEVLVGLCAFGVALLFKRKWDVACMIGWVLLVIILWVTPRPLAEKIYPVLMLPLIALKKLLHIRLTRHAST